MMRFFNPRLHGVKLILLDSAALLCFIAFGFGLGRASTHIDALRDVPEAAQVTPLDDQPDYDWRLHHNWIDLYVGPIDEDLATARLGSYDRRKSIAQNAAITIMQGGSILVNVTICGELRNNDHDKEAPVLVVGSHEEDACTR